MRKCAPTWAPTPQPVPLSVILLSSPLLGM